MSQCLLCCVCCLIFLIWTMAQLLIHLPSHSLTSLPSLLSPGWQQPPQAPMELRCSSCLVSLTIIPLATTYKQCGHKLCHRCYLNYNQSRVCVMCIYSEAKSKRSIPETHTGTPQPRPPLHTPPPPSASTLPTPDFPASSPNITHTTTTTTAHTGASQNHALEAGSRSSPHKEDSSQSSPRQTGDNWRPNDSEVRP